MKRVSLRFKWYDIWIGVYIAPNAIYVCPLPCLLLTIRRNTAYIAGAFSGSEEPPNPSPVDCRRCDGRGYTDDGEDCFPCGATGKIAHAGEPCVKRMDHHGITNEPGIGTELIEDLRRVLCDPSIIIKQDQAVWELLAKWRNAPSNTASADPHARYITLDADAALAMQAALNRTLAKLDTTRDDADIRCLQPLVLQLASAAYAR